MHTEREGEEEKREGERKADAVRSTLILIASRVPVLILCSPV
jgi:hypothetical protein